MILALHSVRRRWVRFAGSALGLSLLATAVMAMAGIHAGVVKDATWLARSMSADLWVVEAGTRGPFAESSRLDPDLERRISVLPNVSSARAFSFQVVERSTGRSRLRTALVGLSWPEDRGAALPISRGRAIGQARGEVLADVTLGLPVGSDAGISRESHRVSGIVDGAVTFSGDGVLFTTISDFQRIVTEQSPEAIRLGRARTLDRLRDSELGKTSPAMEPLAVDDRWRKPGLDDPSIAAVLVRADTPRNIPAIAAALARWPDVSVHTQQEQEAILLDGVVARARLQLRLFASLLTVTAALLVALLLYLRTLEQAREIALLKLMGASARRVAGMVVSEAWLLGVFSYVVARGLGELVFPHFPRRIDLTASTEVLGPLLALAVTTLASVGGLFHAWRIDPSRTLDG